MLISGLGAFAAQPVVEAFVPPHGKVRGPGQPATNALEKILAWNKTTNELEIEAGAATATFNFSVTNISPTPVRLMTVDTSCHCTTARLPDLPMALPPRASLSFEVDVDISDKQGQVTKVVTLSTDKGEQDLLVIADIKPVMTGLSADDRRDNIKTATVDRQAVFRDDCARCHVEPAQRKMGKELFIAACGICHESDHRATMVPDLHHLPVETSAAFWSTWITYGKPNTLMPAFAESQGGFLTPEQVTSLVDYLVGAIPPQANPAPLPKTN